MPAAATAKDNLAPTTRVIARTTPAAALTALGIVYGDLGTSPLYTLETIVHAVGRGFTAQIALGVLSLIFWALLITISAKYCLFVMRADNHGEGGILALMSLIGASWSGRWRGRALIVMGLFGAALIYMATASLRQPSRCSVRSKASTSRLVRSNFRSCPLRLRSCSASSPFRAGAHRELVRFPDR